MAERFRERVDDVKCDLIDAFKALVKTDGSGTAKEEEKCKQISAISQKIVAELIKQSKNKNLKVKIAVMSCLAALADTLKTQLDKHFSDILPVIFSTIQET